MLFPRFAKAIAALFLVTIGFAAPVHAQGNKQIISGTWYEDRATNTNSSSILVLTFAQTPANQFLNVTNVSCNVIVGSTQSITGMSLYAGTTSGADDLGRNYEIKGNVAPEFGVDVKVYSVVTNQIYYKFGPGRYPSISLSTSTTGGFANSVQCVIVGNLTDN